MPTPNVQFKWTQIRLKAMHVKRTKLQCSERKQNKMQTLFYFSFGSCTNVTTGMCYNCYSKLIKYISRTKENRKKRANNTRHIHLNNVLFINIVIGAAQTNVTRCMILQYTYRLYISTCTKQQNGLTMFSTKISFRPTDNLNKFSPVQANLGSCAHSALIKLFYPRKYTCEQCGHLIDLIDANISLMVSNICFSLKWLSTKHCQ